jgi:hypothetical protein
VDLTCVLVLFTSRFFSALRVGVGCMYRDCTYLTLRALPLLALFEAEEG